jgi:Phosphotransferase enzyme family
MDVGSISRPLPRTAADISASWLTSVLGMGEISDVQVRPLGSSNGFTGQVARLQLTAADAPAPTTLIVKLPNADEGRKAPFHRLGYAARELSFYRTIAPSSPVRVPRLYVGAVDPKTGDSLLLLEDLGAARCLGTPDSNCGIDDAINAVKAIARFHAAHWGKADVFDWIPDARLGAAKAQQALTGPWWPVFEELVNSHPSDLLSAGAPLTALAECLGARFIDLKGATARPPTTIVHSDFRGDNLFRTGDREIAIIDWENIARARGPSMSPCLRSRALRSTLAARSK